MQLLSSRFMQGPNVHHGNSVLLARVDLAGMPELLKVLADPTAQVPAPPAALPDALRPLADLWRESAGTPLERILRLALDLQRDRTVVAATFARVLDVSGATLEVALECEVDAAGLAALQMAIVAAPLFLVGAAGRHAAYVDHVAGQFAQFRQSINVMSLDQLTLAMLREACRRGIPWQRLGQPHRFVQLGQGIRGRRLHETMIDTTGRLAVMLTANKAAATELLGRLGLPVPRQMLVFSADEATAAAAQIGYPVVVKPCHGAKGRAVSVGLTTPQQVTAAYGPAAEGADSVVVESVVAGDDHRLLVVGGRLVAAARRVPAHVVGDGISTVAQLLAALNRDPRRGRGFEKLMNFVDMDREAAELLAAQQLSPASVPAAGARAWLRRTSNIHRGGSAEDVTDSMHPDNRRLAEDAARAVGLDVAGIDFLTPDIGRSWREAGGAIIEVNANPGLRPHWLGDPRRDVVGPILDLLVPPGVPTRIPTAAVTGSIGKTTTCRMLAHILAATNKRVGLATTQGVFLDGAPLKQGDYAGGRAAANLLLHPQVEAGVFEMARGGLIKGGLVIDRCDVAAVLNVLDNHVGLDGVASREELARVKRLVADAASDLLVLNADDPLCLAMREGARSARLCLFSVRHDSAELAAHRAAGGLAVFIDGRGATSRIVLAEGTAEVGTLAVGDIPATLGGYAMGKATNAAFALALAYGMGISFATGATALRSFDATYGTNPGRLNSRDDLPFGVLVDWPDGPEATAELAAVAKQLPATGRRRLLLTAMGNRPDDYLIRAGKAAAGPFDHCVLSNYTDLRGRSPDAVPALLRQGLLAAGVTAEHIRCVADVDRALDELLAAAQPGDLVVIGTFATERVWRRLEAVATSPPPPS